MIHTLLLPGGVSNNDIVTIKSYDTVAEFSSIDDNGSSTAITIDSASNVGIGTASPARDLHVATADAIAARFQHTRWCIDDHRTYEQWVESNPSIYRIIGQSVILGASGVTDFSVTSSGNFEASNAAGPALLNEAATNTNPTLLPRKTDTGTGWGSNGANNLEGIVGSVRSVLFGAGATTFYASGGSEVARIDRSSGNVAVGTTTADAAVTVYKSADSLDGVSIRQNSAGSSAGQD